MRQTCQQPLDFGQLVFSISLLHSRSILLCNEIPNIPYIHTCTHIHIYYIHSYIHTNIPASSPLPPTFRKTKKYLLTRAHPEVAIMLRPTVFSTPLLLLLVCYCGATLSQATTTAPFESAVPVSSSAVSTPSTGIDGNSSFSDGGLCPLRYHDCAVIGQPNVCCTLDQVCINDDSGQPACCQFRTKCVGSVHRIHSSSPKNAGFMLGLNAFLAAGSAAIYLANIYPL